MIEASTSGPIHRLRRLILLDVSSFLVLGLFSALVPGSRPSFSTTVLLTSCLIVAALVSLGLWDLAPVSHPSRLARAFAGLNALVILLVGVLAAEATEHETELWAVWVGGFMLFHLMMALAFLREGLLLPGSEPPERRRLRSWLAEPGDEAAREERKRLARDLHDSIKQQLFSIKVSAAAAEARWESDPAGAREALADVRRSAQAAMVETQALLRQLRPEAVAVVGFVEALREQCEALGYRTGAEVELELGELPPEAHLSHDTRENLFRIAQEALSNIARHARARNVHIWFGTMKNEEAHLLVLRVRDDGQGFDPAATTDGMGLRNIRERAESLPAVMALESSPGGGTELRIYIRLQEPQASPKEVAIRRAFANVRTDLLLLALYCLIHFDGFTLFYPVLFLGVAVATPRRGLVTLTADTDPAAGPLSQLWAFRRSYASLMLSWWILVLWPPDGGPLTAWEGVRAALATLLALLALREAWIFFGLYQGAPHDRRAGNLTVLAALLACSLAGLLWLLLQGDPERVARIVLWTSGGLCLSWWLWTWTQWRKGTTKP